jgi:hypothetical protein
MKTPRAESLSDKHMDKEEGIKKLPFVEPKLAFVQPKLVKQGKVEEITAGFFGNFYP